MAATEGGEKPKPMTESQVRDWLTTMGIKSLALVINKGHPGLMMGAPDGGDGIFIVYVERSSTAALESIRKAQVSEG